VAQLFLNILARINFGKIGTIEILPSRLNAHYKYALGLEILGSSSNLRRSRRGNARHKNLARYGPREKFHWDDCNSRVRGVERLSERSGS
jgi:hypothetical protein